MHPLAAFRAGMHRLDHGAAAAMSKLERRALGIRRPAVSPLHQLDEDPPEIDALARQPVLVSRRALVVELPPRMPSATSVFSLSLRMLRATPMFRWKSSNRRTPRNDSRRTCSVHRSPITSSVEATEHASRGKSLMSVSPQPR